MSLSRVAIVDQLKEIVGADRVITDETVLKKNSIDRFRKFPDIHGIYTLPIPTIRLVRDIGFKLMYFKMIATRHLIWLEKRVM